MGRDYQRGHRHGRPVETAGFSLGLRRVLGESDRISRSRAPRHRQRPEWPNWFSWSSEELKTGQVADITSGYRKEETWLALTSPNNGPGIVIGWESNAEAVCGYGDLIGNGWLVLDCALFPEYQIRPGQTLTGPAGFVVLAESDLDELSFRCHRFVDDILSWKADDELFPHVTFNSWGYIADIDEPSMYFCLDLCRRLGVEQFVVDFGWEDPDWYPLKDRFPNGLAPIADIAHASGIRFGIHLSYGNISSLCSAYLASRLGQRTRTVGIPP